MSPYENSVLGKLDETSEYPVIYGLYMAIVTGVLPQAEVRQVSVIVAVVPV